MHSINCTRKGACRHRSRVSVSSPFCWLFSSLPERGQSPSRLLPVSPSERSEKRRWKPAPPTAAKANPDTNGSPKRLNTKPRSSFRSSNVCLGTAPVLPSSAPPSSHLKGFFIQSLFFLHSFDRDGDFNLSVRLQGPGADLAAWPTWWISLGRKRLQHRRGAEPVSQQGVKCQPDTNYRSTSNSVSVSIDLHQIQFQRARKQQQ